MRSDSLPAQSQIEPDACPETAREIGVRFERASGARSDGESRPSPSGACGTRRSACDDLRGVKLAVGCEMATVVGWFWGGDETGEEAVVWAGPPPSRLPEGCGSDRDRMIGVPSRGW